MIHTVTRQRIDRPRSVQTLALGAVVALLVVAAIGYFLSSLAWFDRPYPGFKVRIDRTVELQLPPRSTGAQAALMPGDRILAVDGRALQDPRDLYAYVAARPIGTPIRYELERSQPDGGISRLSKAIPTQQHDWREWASFFLAFWLTGVSFLVLGIVIAAVKPGDPLVRASTAFHLAGAAACLSIFDQSTRFLSPYNDPAKLLQWLIAVFFTNLALQFPRKVPAAATLRRLNLILGLSLAIVLLACQAAGQWQFWVTFGHLAYIALGELILLANALWAFLDRRSTPSERGQGKTLLLGTLVSTVPVLIVPQAHSLGIHVNLEGLQNFAQPLWPLAISYAIVRYDLFDLRPLVRRSLTYLLSAGILALLYMAVTGATETLIGQHTGFPGFLATALVALAFTPVRDRVKTWLDARFFRAPYQFDHVLATFTRTAQENVDPAVLIRAYRDAIGQALAPTRIGLYFERDRLNEAAAPWFSVEDRAALRPFLHDKPTTATWRGETVQVLPMVVQDHVLGHAVLGAKKSGLAYTEGDRALLRQLTEFLAVWLNLFERFEQVRLQSQEIEALKHSEAMQGQFLNIVSHELKLPLSVIMTSLDNLKRTEARQDPKTVNNLLRIRRSLTHLRGLVADLLNAGQLQSGHFRLNLRDIDLAEIAGDAVTEMRLLADLKTQVLSLTLSPGLPPLQGDATRLGQVFRNLIHNAIRYSPAGATIQVDVSSDGSHVRSEVRDNGPGIAAEAQAHLFERFSQAHAGTPDRDQGVGLGLFIARAIVEANGGTIGVQSQPGHGSRFWFSLPVTAQPSDTATLQAIRELS